MAQSLQMLLVENVDGVGIVGDIVKVRPGFARNYLVPHGLATLPDDELISQLADRRREAEAERAALRKSHEEAVEKLENHSVTTVRACNDQGQLYGSVTQHDIAEMLSEQGFPVRDRDVRMSHVIKAIGTHEVTVKFAADLETELTVIVESDRPLDIHQDEQDTDEEPAAEGEAAEASGEQAPADQDSTDEAEQPTV